MTYKIWQHHLKFFLLVPLLSLLLVTAGCGASDTPESVVVEKEVIKEVPVEVIVEKEVIREVEKEVVREVVATPAPVEAPSNPDKRPGTLIWATGLNLASQDAHTWATQNDSQIHERMFDALIRDEGWSETGPMLAESWTLDSDLITWTYNLRQDVQFHNGDSMTADDVSFSILRLRDLPMGSLKRRVGHIADVTVVDPYTVKVVTEAPHPGHQELMTNSRIYSANQAAADGEKFFEMFNGAGPWKFDEWVTGTKFSFERNENWWDEFADGVPSAIEHRPIPEEATQVAALLSGGIDLLPALGLEPSGKVAEAPGYYVIRSPSSSGPLTVFMGSDRPPFDDPKMRLALEFATDRETIAQHIVGNGIPAYSNAHPNSRYNPPGFTGRLYDIEQAKQLVSESDYDGQEIRMIGRSARYPKDVEVAQFLVATWKEELGLNVKLEVLGSSAFSARRDAGEYELYQGGFTLGVAGGPAYRIHSQMISQQVGYHDTHPEFKAITESLQTEMDPEIYQQIVWEAMNYMREDPAAVTLYYYDQIFGVSDRIQELVNLPGQPTMLFYETVMSPSARAR